MARGKAQPEVDGSIDLEAVHNQSHISVGDQYVDGRVKVPPIFEQQRSQNEDSQARDTSADAISGGSGSNPSTPFSTSDSVNEVCDLLDGIGSEN
jgi:hypothetical protein